MTLISAGDLARSLVGSSRVMMELRASIAKLAPLSLPVLVLGPRGAGKELVAQALHAASGRPGRFVAFNACAIADAMFEDAIFGHVRGAFTGALSETAGYLTEAHRGTAFFDEITGVSPANQRKLLRVLETRAFRPIGARADRESDFRLVSATNDELDGMIADGRFRSDLADRLGVMSIRVPPLREHPSDIAALAEHFLHQMDAAGSVTLSNAALRALEAHAWPGNVRQLRNVLHRATLFAGASTVNRSDVDAALDARLSPAADREVSRADFERRRLIAVMDSVAWSVEQAAVALGVHPTTVYRRLRRWGLARHAEPHGDGRRVTSGTIESRVNTDGSIA